MMLTTIRPSYLSTEVTASSSFRVGALFFGVFPLSFRLFWRIDGNNLQVFVSNPPEVFDERFGAKDERFIEKRDSATTDITGAINLERYGIVNCKREWNITVRWRETESGKSGHRLADVVGKLRNCHVKIPHVRILRLPILWAQLSAASNGVRQLHMSVGTSIDYR